MTERYTKIRIIDSHTEGEPTRLVYEGFPYLGDGSIQEKLQQLKMHHDQWRKAVILEPRGNDILVGALLCKPSKPEATAAVIFFNNSGYLGMCGHGTIGLMASLHYLGKVEPGEHLIETPVGDVRCTIFNDGSVGIQNIVSYRYKKAISIDVPELGTVTGDIAWGGNWFFLVSQKFIDINLANVSELTTISSTIKQALQANNITGKDGAEIDHIELFQDHPTADSQSFVLCPGNAYDRSPCGTGTSAKLACLAADGVLAPETVWHQASVIGSEFQASYKHTPEQQGIIPFIRGKAYICAETTLIIDDKDPFKWGIVA